MDAGFIGRLLALLAHVRVNLDFGLGYQLFNAGRMDAAVEDQLGEGVPGDLAANRIVAGEHDGLGRIVNDEVHAGSLLQRPDIAPLLPDDAALHLVVGDRHDGLGHLDGLVRSVALDRLGDDPPGTALGFFLCLPLDVPYPARRLLANLRLDALEKQLFRLFLRQAAQALQKLRLLLGGNLRLRVQLLDLRILPRDGTLTLIQPPGPLLDVFFPLVEPPLAALQPPLALTPVSLGSLAQLRRLVLGVCEQLVVARLRFSQQLGGRLVGLAYSRLTPPLAQYGADSEREARYHDTDNKEYNRFHL